MLAVLPLLLPQAEAEAVAIVTVSSMDRRGCRDADLAEARGRYCRRYCPLPSVLVVVIVPLQQLVVVAVVVGRHYYWPWCSRFACFRC